MLCFLLAHGFGLFWRRLLIGRIVGSEQGLDMASLQKFLVINGDEFEQIDLRVLIELSSECACSNNLQRRRNELQVMTPRVVKICSTYMIAILIPIDEGRFGTLDVVVIIGQLLLSSILEDHLDIADSTLEMRAIISRQRGRGDLICFRALVVGIPQNLSRDSGM